MSDSFREINFSKEDEAYNAKAQTLRNMIPLGVYSKPVLKTLGYSRYVQIISTPVIAGIGNKSIQSAQRK